MRVVLALVATALLGSLSSVGTTPAALATTAAVSVVDDAYVDGASGNSTTTIPVGDTVLWTWAGINEHTVSTTSSEAFDSGTPSTTGSFSHTFNASGTFTYVCGIHGAAMTGTVIVQAGAQPTNTPLPPTNTPVSRRPRRFPTHLRP